MEYLDDRESNNSYIWTNKHKPQTIDDIIGNENGINLIKNWLNSFDENKRQAFYKINLKKKNQKNKMENKKKNPTVKEQKSKTRKTKNNNKNITQNPIKDENVYDPNNICNSVNTTDIPYNDDSNYIDDMSYLDIDNTDDIDDANIDDDNIGGERKHSIDHLITSSKKRKNNDARSCLIVTGKHGIGKTVIIKTLLTSLNYVIQKLNFNKIKNNKCIKDIIDKMANNSDIVAILDNKEKKKIAIVIDELETITSGINKNCICALLKNNEKKWICPIILITNNQHSKFLSDIKKISYEVKFFPPKEDELRKLLIKIISKENINIQGVRFYNSSTIYDDFSVVRKILEYSQDDFRRLIILLYHLKINYKTRQITLDIINEYCNNCVKKDIDNDLFKITNYLLKDYKGIDDCIRYYETEKVALPLMVHQNYLECIRQKFYNEQKKYELVSEISDLLSEGDVIDNYIFGDQNWDMFPVHVFYSCVGPSFLLNNNNKTYLNLEYPSDFNKTSTMHNNKKKMSQINAHFKNKNIHDCVYICMIIKNLIAEGRIKECTNILKNYNASLSDIEVLLKIDKIKSNKTSLTNKQKKEILSGLNSQE